MSKKVSDNENRVGDGVTKKRKYPTVAVKQKLNLLNKMDCEVNIASQTIWIPFVYCAWYSK